MTRIALAATLTLALSAAVQAAGPAAPPSAAPAPMAATPVVEVFVGGGYYGYPYRRYYRPYPLRPWYYYGGPVYYEAPAPAVVVVQPPPQPAWTGSDVIWLFPGAPQ